MHFAAQPNLLQLSVEHEVTAFGIYVFAGKVTHIPYRDSKLTRILQDALVKPLFLPFFFFLGNMMTISFDLNRVEILELLFCVAAHRAP